MNCFLEKLEVQIWWAFNSSKSTKGQSEEQGQLVARRDQLEENEKGGNMLPEVVREQRRRRDEEASQFEEPIRQSIG